MCVCVYVCVYLCAHTRQLSNPSDLFHDSYLLAICRPSGCTVVSSVVVVVVICNRSQMRTSKCTCSIFGVSIGLDPG